MSKESEKIPERLTISIEQPTLDFLRHLSIQDNSRVMFSAPFGTGKTYFLKTFFEDKKDKYSTIYLAPVNYSVASNEDIFELIKYDILFDLLSKNIQFDRENFSKLLTFHSYLSSNQAHIIKSIIEIGSKINKTALPLLELLEKIPKFVEEYQQYHNSIQQNDVKKIINYLKSFVEKKGNIYEEDFFTKIICDALEQLKASGQETILIIDDLDRIDPDHTFRLLNVFAAHFDKDPSQNKFGFDKIIFVCDVSNIRNMFNAKFGHKTDFSGYIDKFYTAEVFEFNNSEALKIKIRNILQSIKLNNEYETLRPYFLGDELVFIMENMVYSNALGIRVLARAYNRKFDIYPVPLNIGAEVEIRNDYCAILLMFDFLKWIMGEGRNLHQAFIKTRDHIRVKGESRDKYPIRMDYEEYAKLIGTVLTLLAYKVHRFLLFGDSELFTFDYHEKKLKCSLFINENEEKLYSVYLINVDGNEENIRELEYFEMVADAYELYNGSI